MRRDSRGWLASCFIVVFVLFSIGCGGGDDRGPFVFTQLSDQNADGYISSELDLGTGLPKVFSAAVTQSIQVGVDEFAFEYRGFLDFPLAGLPLNADVRYAEIEVFVNAVPFAGNVPVLMELVDFQPPALIGSDFFRSAPEPFLPPILSRDIFTFLPGDAIIDPVTGFPPPVRIEVTTLVREAQFRGQPDFQVRLLLDPALGTAPPRIAILDDGAADTAPLLYVEYF